MSSKGKILVIRGGAIGDFILTLPVFAALRSQFPEAHLEVLGYPHIAQLALVSGLVDRVQPIEARALAGFFARNGELSEDLRDYFSEFNIILSYLYDPDEIFKTNIARCALGQFLCGPHRPDETQPAHATEVYLKPLERLAIFAADPVPRINLAGTGSPASKIFRAGKESGDAGERVPTIALHPGSGSERKNWPEAKWSEFLRWLVESTSLQLLLIGGEAEGRRLEQLAQVLPGARCVVARSRPLDELAVRLRACAAFVGHDSGITHLAAAVGLPTLVLWPHTPMEIWRPQGNHVKILRARNGLRELSVRAVTDEVRALLPL